MEFDKSRVYTALNADESLIGAKGYFADSIASLKNIVKVESEQHFSNVRNINDYFYLIGSSLPYNFFYLVEPAIKWYVIKDILGDVYKQSKKPINFSQIQFSGSMEECEQFISEHSKPKKEIAQHCLKCDKFNTHCVGEYEGVSDSCNYRKPKYRPFKDCDELINEYCKKISRTQLNWLDCQPTELPSIWVKDKDSKYQIVSYSNCCSGDYVHIFKVNYVATVGLKELFDNYTFLDGNVCGVEE